MLLLCRCTVVSRESARHSHMLCVRLCCRGMDVGSYRQDFVTVNHRGAALPLLSAAS